MPIAMTGVNALGKWVENHVGFGAMANATMILLML